MDRARVRSLAERVLRLEGESVLALCARLDDRFVDALHRGFKIDDLTFAYAAGRRLTDPENF